MKLGFCILAICFLPWIATAQVGATQQLPGHVPAVTGQLAPIGRLDEAQQLQLSFGLPLRNRITLTNLLREIYDPASPNYHHYLTPQQFTDAFGPTAADYESVAAFAAAQGFQISKRHPNRLILDVSGPVSTVEKALHVKMQAYRHPTENRQFFAPDAEPSIAIGIPILHIGGLNSYALPHPLLAKKQALNVLPMGAPATGSGLAGLYLGNDFRAAYVPGSSLLGAGQTVGLLEFDGYYPSDIATYNGFAGIAAVPLTNVYLDSFDGSPGLNNTEVALDIEMVSSVAPGVSSIVVYEGITPDDILNQMANDNSAKQLSSSWSYSIDAVSEEIFLQFAAQGQSFVNSSGDGDAWVGDIATPCDDPNITIVGGTTLTTTGPGGAWQSETVWNWGNEFGLLYDGQGSGGGISHSYLIPSYQSGLNMSTNLGSTALRNIPDVAMTADNIFAVADDGQFEEVGGTSCATALFAGFIALANEQAASYARAPLGFLNPAIYAIGRGSFYTNAFHDITTGDNTWSQSPTLFHAVPGYDLCTGWAAPAGTNLINLLAPDSLQISPSTNLMFSGNKSGPFKPSFITCSLTNGGTNSVSWSVAAESPWLSVSPTSGSLEPGGLSTSVELSINSAAAANLPDGFSTNVIWFTNLADGVVQSFPVTLSIIAAPSFISAPSSITQLEGATASFNSLVLGGMPMSFQWRHDNTNLVDSPNISGAQSVVTSYPPNNPFLQSMLILSNVSAADAGSYVLVASNAAGVLTSHTVTLTIASSGPVLTVQPTNATVLFGSPAQMSVVALGNRPMSYQWLLDGAPLVDGSNISGSATPTLTILSASATNIGSYSVIVTNSLGSKTSVTAHLTVDVLFGGVLTNADGPPIIVTQPASQSGLLGDPAAFAVTSAGSVPLSYQWEFNHSPIEGATNATLTLASLSESDAGIYSVIVSNLLGTAVSSDASLSVFSGTSELITFDDLAPGINPVPNGYNGLAWSNFFYLNAASVPFSGYNAGMVSVPNVAFNQGAGVATVSSSTAFSLLSASLTSAWNDNLNVEAKGFNASGLAYDKSFTLSATAPTVVPFNFIGVTSVQFVASGGSFHSGYEGFGGAYFAMDNVAVKVATNTFDTAAISVLYSFGGPDGGYPVSSLAPGPDGNLYGATQYGGTNGFGSVFKITTNGLLTTLASLDSSNAMPFGGLVLGPDGKLYGTTQVGGTNDDGSVFSVTTNGVLTTVASFDSLVTGADPEAPLVVGPDGNLYGTTYFGGSNDVGSVFSLTTNGVMTGICSFNFANGAYPLASLTLGNDGFLYGTTLFGGANGLGTVFKITTNGALTTLFSFYSSPTGASPAGALTQASDGNFYGVTFYGGTNGSGTAFSISPQGVFSNLASFNLNANGGNLESGLIQGNDGNFYGTSIYGGAHSYGTIFSMTTNGVLTTLAAFNGTNGIAPEIGASFAKGMDGNLYGTASFGGLSFNGAGSSGDGVIFRLGPAQVAPSIVAQPNSLSTPLGGVAQFTVAAAGSGPLGYAWFCNGVPIVGASSATYSTNNIALSDSGDEFFCIVSNSYGAATSSIARLNVFSASGPLHTFTAGDGATLYSAPITGADGRLYGATFYGGAGNCGTIYAISTNGAMTSIASFDYYSTGANPFAALVQASDGSFYGTTANGGKYGYGTVFNVTTNGVLSTLFAFNSYNGSSPYGGVILGDDGNLYGTTFYGGSFNGGSLFKLTPGGVLTTLASFDGTMGAYPLSSLTKGPNGVLYGTSYYSGADDFGTVFSVNASGKLSLLHSFAQTDGAGPYGPMIFGKDGNLYGTTASGGSNGNGTVFKITTNGILTSLFSFDGTNGGDPHGSLAAAPDGSLYGCAFSGGPRGAGVVFNLTTNGAFTDLYSFDDTDGFGPSDLRIASDGSLVGVTAFGGAGFDGYYASGGGIVFRVLPSSLVPGGNIVATYGASNVTLSGKISAQGFSYPPPGESVTATIDGVSQIGSITDSIGDFSISFDLHAIPAGTNAYPIAYTYAGDNSFAAVANSTSTLTVNPLPVIFTGSRNYDGSTNADADVLVISNALPGDDVAAMSGTAGLAASSAGTNALTSSGSIVLGGSAAENYTLAGFSGSVVINPLPVTLAGSRPYDETATINASLLNIETNYDGTNLALQGSAALATNTAGSEPIVDLSALTLVGSAASNYTLLGASGLVNITPLPLTIALGNASKQYGQTLALDPTAFTVVNAPFGSETITAVIPISPGSLANASVAGSPYPITATGATGSNGFNAANYQMTFAPGQLSISQLAAILTGNRNYDATTNFAATNLVVSNAIAGDDVYIASGNVGLVNAGVGTNAISSFDSLALGGAASGNYSLSGVRGSVVITPLPITLTGSRAYDGTVSIDAAALNFAANYDGTNLTLTGFGALAASTVGVEPITNFISLALGGSEATNYTLDGASGTVTINPLAVVLIGSKTYDGATNVEAIDLTVSNVIGSDEVFPISGSASLGAADVGTNAIVSASTLLLGGADATNYTVAGAEGEVIITPLTVMITGSKPYDGTAIVPASYLMLATNYDGTNVALGGSVTLSSSAAGTNSVIDFSTLTLTGSAAPNYALNSATGYVVISPLALTITMGSAAKSYGQPLTLDPTAFTVTGAAFGSEVVTAVSPESDGASPSASVAGSPYPISASGVSGSNGFNPNNYQITYVPGQLTVHPLVAELSGSRFYDATTNADASVLVVSNAFPGDEVELISGSGGLSGADIGTNAITSLGDLSLGGPAATNYSLVGSQGSVVISPLPVSITGSRPYDETSVADATILSLETNYDGTNLTLSGAATLSSSNAGTNSIIDFTALTLSGSAATNYTLENATGAVVITPLPLTIILSNAAKSYGQSITLNPLAFSVVGAPFGSETVTAVDSVSAGAAANAPIAGSPYDITGVGATGSNGFLSVNYQLSYIPGLLTIRPLLAVLDGTRYYDASTNAAAGVLTVSNAVPGDDVYVISGGAGLSSAGVGTNAITSFNSIELGGASADNYLLPTPPGPDSNFHLNSGIITSNDSSIPGYIVVKPLPVTLSGERLFDGADLVQASILNIETNYDGTNLGLSGSATLASPNVGSEPIVDFSTLLLTGSAATNYTLSGAVGFVSILNPAAPFSTTSINLVGTNLTVCWQSTPGVVYDVLTSTNLTPPVAWQLAGDPVIATDTNTCDTIVADPSTNSVTIVWVKTE